MTKISRVRTGAGRVASMVSKPRVSKALQDDRRPTRWNWHNFDPKEGSTNPLFLRHRSRTAEIWRKAASIESQASKRHAAEQRALYDDAILPFRTLLDDFVYLFRILWDCPFPVLRKEAERLQPGAHELQFFIRAVLQGDTIIPRHGLASQTTIPSVIAARKLFDAAFDHARAAEVAVHQYMHHSTNETPLLKAFSAYLSYYKKGPFSHELIKLSQKCKYALSALSRSALRSSRIWSSKISWSQNYGYSSLFPRQTLELPRIQTTWDPNVGYYSLFPPTNPNSVYIRKYQSLAPHMRSDKALEESSRNRKKANPSLIPQNNNVDLLGEILHNFKNTHPTHDEKTSQVQPSKIVDEHKAMPTPQNRRKSQNERHLARHAIHWVNRNQKSSMKASEHSG